MANQTHTQTNADKPAQSTAYTGQRLAILGNAITDYKSGELLGELHPLTDDQTRALLAAVFHEPEEMTLTDAIDAFPILRGARLGLMSRPGDRAAYITDGEEFVYAAARAGSGAQACAMILCELTGTAYGKTAANFDWSLAVAKLDSEHRAALARVLAGFVKGGGF